MKKLLISLFLLTLTIYGGHLLANDASLPGDDPDYMIAMKTEEKDSEGNVIKTTCVHCASNGSCEVLICL
ncbi:hypothetical protein B879_00782 [Cecembia lonarensis LW9]|uniref:Secreted protein n=1 Tax=Cecembia lonarensis (strain CCUG 58316 / KCTC 22772 / LW9) TaxID=1225176 RepID=K1M2R4_CECL9|nr:hypothetical protein B879_00782 [Cecembia lonarensis LW9]